MSGTRNATQSYIHGKKRGNLLRWRRRIGLLAAICVASPLVGAPSELVAAGEVVVGVGGDPASAARSGCFANGVNALIDVGGVVYASGKTTSSCTDGSTASEKGWVVKLVGNAWQPVGAQSTFDGAVSSLLYDGTTLYAGGKFTNKLVTINPSTATSSTAWSTLPTNPFRSTTSYHTVTYSFAEIATMQLASGTLYVGGKYLKNIMYAVDPGTGSVTAKGNISWSATANNTGAANDSVIVGSRLFVAYDMGSSNVSPDFVGGRIAFTDDWGTSWTAMTGITTNTRQIESDGTNIYAATASALISFDAATAAAGTTPSSLRTWSAGPFQALAYASNTLCSSGRENDAKLSSSPYSSFTNMSSTSISATTAVFVSGKCFWAGSGTKDQTYTSSSSWIVKWDQPPPSLSPASQTRVTKIDTAMSATSTLTPSAFTSTPTFSISPSLPAGLSLNTSSGVISGTPTVAQAATVYTITGTAGSETATATVTITVNSITPASQTISGTVNTAISASTAYTASHFVGSVSYAVTSGALPAGLAINPSTGVVSGTPTAASTASITVTATGTTSGSATGTITFAITAVTPSTQTMAGTVGAAVAASTALTPAGFSGSVSYAVTSGTLPTGLSIDPSTGVISGVPAATSSATVTITATGATSGSAVATVTFNIVQAAIAPTTQTISGTVDSAITDSVAFTPTNFTGTVTYVVTAGTLPAGLQIAASTGVISGTPTAVSSATVTITATGATAGTASASVTFAIGPAPTTTTTPSTATTTPSTTTTAPATTTTTAPAVTTTTVPAPQLVTASNQAQIEADPGQGAALINGKKVDVEVVKPEATNDPAALLESAKQIVSDLDKFIPKGAENPVKVVETDEGASLTGILSNPDDPNEQIPVPVESVTLVKAGNEAAMLVSALNQTNVPAVLNAGGTIEVTRGGTLAAVAYGLPASETGEIVLMSTPRLLQTFTVDGSGGFKGQVPLPKNIEFGSHTVVMATRNAKVSLGIKLVRTRLEYRIKKKTAPNLFLRRAGIGRNSTAPYTVSAQGRCKANNKVIRFSAKPGRCFITVKQAAQGNKKAIFYRFTVQVVTKPKRSVAKR